MKERFQAQRYTKSYAKAVGNYQLSSADSPRAEQKRDLSTSYTIFNGKDVPNVRVAIGQVSLLESSPVTSATNNLLQKS